MSYYKQIKGIKYDRGLLELAEEAGSLCDVVSSTGVSPTTYFRLLFLAAFGPLSLVEVSQQSSAVFTAC